MAKEILNVSKDAKTILNGIRSQASQTYKDIHSNSVATLYVHRKAL